MAFVKLSLNFVVCAILIKAMLAAPTTELEEKVFTIQNSEVTTTIKLLPEEKLSTIHVAEGKLFSTKEPREMLSTSPYLDDKHSTVPITEENTFMKNYANENLSKAQSPEFMIDMAQISEDNMRPKEKVFTRQNPAEELIFKLATAQELSDNLSLAAELVHRMATPEEILNILDKTRDISNKIAIAQELINQELVQQALSNISTSTSPFFPKLITDTSLSTAQDLEGNPYTTQASDLKLITTQVPEKNLSTPEVQEKLSPVWETQEKGITYIKAPEKKLVKRFDKLPISQEEHVFPEELVKGMALTAFDEQEVSDIMAKAHIIHNTLAKVQEMIYKKLSPISSSYMYSQRSGEHLQHKKTQSLTTYKKYITKRHLFYKNTTRKPTKRLINKQMSDQELSKHLIQSMSINKKQINTRELLEMLGSGQGQSHKPSMSLFFTKLNTTGNKFAMQFPMEKFSASPDQMEILLVRHTPHKKMFIRSHRPEQRIFIRQAPDEKQIEEISSKITFTQELVKQLPKRLTPTQDQFTDMTQTQEISNKLTSAQELVKRLSNSSTPSKVLFTDMTTAQELSHKLTAIQDTVNKLAAAQELSYKLARVQDLVNKLTSAQELSNKLIAARQLVNKIIANQTESKAPLFFPSWPQRRMDISGIRLTSRKPKISSTLKANYIKDIKTKTLPVLKDLPLFLGETLAIKAPNEKQISVLADRLVEKKGTTQKPLDQFNYLKAQTEKQGITVPSEDSTRPVENKPSKSKEKKRFRNTRPDVSQLNKQGSNPNGQYANPLAFYPEIYDSPEREDQWPLSSGSFMGDINLNWW